MLELRTLGQVDLLRDGTPVQDLLQQPKRLVLLAYLAVDPSAPFRSRDTLLGLFWPELDQDHGRAALRRALHFLRRAIGPELLITRGDDVGLEPGSILSDAGSLTTDLEAGRRMEALARYQGPFLPGMYVAGAPEAERWIDEYRQYLRTRAREAAWQEVETLAPSPLAISTAKRALEIDPDDEPGLRRLITLLDGSGDRAGALRVYEEFERRMHVEFECEPAPETLALVQAIRSRFEPVSAVDSPRQGQPAPGPLLMILPFTIHAPAEQHYLGEGMMDLLTTTLNGAGALRTVEPSLVIARLRAARGVVEPTSAAGSVGADGYVTGSLVWDRNTVRAQASIHRLSDGQIDHVEAEGRAEDTSALFGIVDALARQMLTRSFGGGGRLARTAPLTTESMPALKAYLTGEHAFRSGRFQDAIDRFQEAVRLDPSFALGHYRLGASYAATAVIPAARSAADAAFTHRERLNPRDRLLVEGQHAWLNGSVGEAERRYTTLLAHSPDDFDAWFLLGDLRFHSNPDHGRSIIQSREAFERALALDPEHVSATVHLARLDALEQRWEDLDRRVSLLRTLHPDHDQTLGMTALRGYTLERQEDIDWVHQALGKSRALPIAIAFSDLALYSGRLTDAERFGRAAIAAARTPEFRAVSHLVLSHLLLAKGNQEDAMVELDASESAAPAWTLETRAFMLTIPLFDWPDARLGEVHSKLLAWDPRQVSPSFAMPLLVHNPLHAHLRCYLLGLIAARRQDPEDLSTWRESLVELPLPNGREPRLLIDRLARTLSAEILQLRGRPDEALTTLESGPQDLWFQYAVTSPFYARGYERALRARLLEELGRRVEAEGWWASIAERSPYELAFRRPNRRD